MTKILSVVDAGLRLDLLRAKFVITLIMIFLVGLQEQGVGIVSNSLRRDMRVCREQLTSFLF
jgi:hypothetical protein